MNYERETFSANSLYRKTAFVAWLIAFFLPFSEIAQGGISDIILWGMWGAPLTIVLLAPILIPLAFFIVLLFEGVCCCFIAFKNSR